MSTFTVNPRFIYCYATGKPIAQIPDSDFTTIVESLAGLDPEDAESELEIRTLTTMRPSILWTGITPRSIEHMRQVSPRELLAYLMNRLYAPIENSQSRPLTYEARINSLRMRCHIWDIVESFRFQPDQLEQLTLILLELDTCFSLSKLNEPTAVAKAWSESDISKLIQALASWRDTLITAMLKKTRDDKHSREFWTGGSRLTRVALSESFKETKPLSKAAIKREAKVAEENFFASILDGLMVNEIPIQHQPIAPMIKATRKTQAEAEAHELNLKLTHTTVTTLSAGFKFGVKSNG